MSSTSETFRDFKNREKKNPELQLCQIISDSFYKTKLINCRKQLKFCCTFLLV